MVTEIRLPNLGQTSDEMTIVEWYKAEGDKVELAEPLLCVETDKSQVDVESAEEGVLLKVLAQPGELLEAGALLAYIGEQGEELAPAGRSDSETAMAATTEPSTDGAQSQAVPRGPGPVPAAVETRRAAPRVKASPVVRKLAADLGIDLSQLKGSGPGGVIERRDVEQARVAHADGGSQAEDVHDVPPVRRIIARRLTRSIQTIPQFSIAADLDARIATRQIEEHRADGSAKLTFTHLLLRVVARALREHPTMQRLWSDEGPSYRVLSSVDVGLAVAGDDSLQVVTIPAPDRTPLPALVDAVSSAVHRSRAGSLREHDRGPAAISVSNLGMYDVDRFRAIVDPDQTAILAAASVRDRVVAVDGALAVVPQLTVTLSCDHRAVDGVEAAQFLRTVRTLFETDPTGGSE